MTSRSAETVSRECAVRRDAPLRFVTAASPFDGHDAAINVMPRLIQAEDCEVIHLGHPGGCRSQTEYLRAQACNAGGCSAYSSQVTASYHQGCS